MDPVAEEAERILAEQPEVVTIVWREDGTWGNVFLRGERAGYLFYDKSAGGWSVTLNKNWGTPRDVHTTYLTREMAVARIYDELTGAAL